jgi:hypothetical protein
VTHSGIESATFRRVVHQPAAPPRIPSIAAISNVNVVEKTVFKTLENACMGKSMSSVAVCTVLCVEVGYILWRYFCDSKDGQYSV